MEILHLKWIGFSRAEQNVKIGYIGKQTSSWRPLQKSNIKRGKIKYARNILFHFYFNIEGFNRYEINLPLQYEIVFL